MHGGAERTTKDAPASVRGRRRGEHDPTRRRVAGTYANRPVRSRSPPRPRVPLGPRRYGQPDVRKWVPAPIDGKDRDGQAGAPDGRTRRPPLMPGTRGDRQEGQQPPPTRRRQRKAKGDGAWHAHGTPFPAPRVSSRQRWSLSCSPSSPHCSARSRTPPPCRPAGSTAGRRCARPCRPGAVLTRTTDVPQAAASWCGAGATPPASVPLRRRRPRPRAVRPVICSGPRPRHGRRRARHHARTL